MSFGDIQSPVRPTRREILNPVKAGKHECGQIVEHFDTTGATISHHLNIPGRRTYRGPEIEQIYLL